MSSAPFESDFQYPSLKVESANVKYSRNEQTGSAQVESLYEYDHVHVEQDSPTSIKVSLHQQKSTPFLNDPIR